MWLSCRASTSGWVGRQQKIARGVQPAGKLRVAAPVRMGCRDQPPVGLLLCTQKDHALVEYAIANMDNRLFVSKYQLELPRKEELERFLQTKRREIVEG